MYRLLLLTMLILAGCSITRAEEDGTDSAEPILQYKVLVQDTSGTPVGCGDSIIGEPTAHAQTGDVPADLRTGLETLFDMPESRFADVNMAIESLTVVEERAVLNLTHPIGQFLLLGVCADPLTEMQILLTVFQFDAIQEALIYVNGDNLRQMMDASGRSEADAFYHRDEF